MRPAAWLLCALVCASSARASAAETVERSVPETERAFVLELRGGKFLPEIDRALAGEKRPFNDIFGSKKLWLFECELDYEIYQGFGTLSAGIAAGYGVVYGHGLVARSGEAAPDLTVLKTLPLRLLAVYRFDWLDQKHGIPLVPFVKAGPAHVVWWVTDGRGETASFGASERALGGKWGFEVAAGLGLDLNFFDPGLGREFDVDFGVNRVLAFAEVMRLSANSFGKPGLDLSGTTYMFGAAFEF